MSSVTLAQIFNIINGPEDYINVNISLGQCIKTSLEKVSDAINYTSSPFLVDMIYDSTSGNIFDTDNEGVTSLYQFTTRMISVTDTFLTACTTALQAARTSKSSAVVNFEFLNTTFANAQKLFLVEYQNYLSVYNFLFTMEGQVSWLEDGDTELITAVVTSAMQGTNVTLIDDSFRTAFATKWMHTGQLRIVRRVLSYLVNCYQTISIITAPINSKYNGNTVYDESVIETITDNFSTIMTQISTLSIEGSDFLDSFDDWESLAREGNADIDTEQNTIVSDLGDFLTAFENLRTATDTMNSSLSS